MVCLLMVTSGVTIGVTSPVTVRVTSAVTVTSGVMVTSNVTNGDRNTNHRFCTKQFRPNLFVLFPCTTGHYVLYFTPTNKKGLRK